MERYGHLFDKIITFENMYESYLEARKGRKLKPEILRAGRNIEKTIREMQRQLRDGTWKSDRYNEFVCYTEVKRRVIHAPSFRNRIFHHALVRIVRPLFERKFIYDSMRSSKAAACIRQYIEHRIFFGGLPDKVKGFMCCNAT